MAMSMKEQKENFVSNHSGSSSQEVLFVTLIPACLGYELYLLFCSTSKTHVSQSRKVVLEAVLVILPLLSFQASDFIIEKLRAFAGVKATFPEVPEEYEPVSLLIAALALFYPAKILYHFLTSSASGVSFPNPPVFDKFSYLTTYRSTISVSTYIAILLVDFTIFPRKYCKTETWGYGLMDLGTGSYLFSSALVSYYSRGAVGGTSSTAPLFRTIVKAFPLLALGFARLATTKGLEYQEHVTEYGVHWNFFFTLFGVSVLSSAVHALSGWLFPKGGWLTFGPVLLAFALFGAYQAALTFQGLDAYVYDSPRTGSLFAANREGILGCIGYTFLYLLAEEVGNYAIWSKRTAGEAFTAMLAVASASWGVLAALEVGLGAKVSRRATNGMYVLWVVANNTTMLAVMALLHAQQSGVGGGGGGVQPSPVFKAVNRNSLVMFLVANLLTGLVNLCIDTLNTSNWAAYFCVLGYLGVLGGVALFLDMVVDKSIRL